MRPSKEDLQLKRFIAKPIVVWFSKAPTRIKSPGCPAGFTWEGQKVIIKSCLSEWKDYTRRGRMAQNMQPQHARRAEKLGSWGVGRFYFEIQSTQNRFFRIYYDRAPEDASDRHGHWFLLAELEEKPGEST